jgi:hypothetical protein
MSYVLNVVVKCVGGGVGGWRSPRLFNSFVFPRAVIFWEYIFFLITIFLVEFPAKKVPKAECSHASSFLKLSFSWLTFIRQIFFPDYIFHGGFFPSTLNVFLLNFLHISQRIPAYRRNMRYVNLKCLRRITPSSLGRISAVFRAEVFVMAHNVCNDKD